jgi:hypothetical protein
MPINQPRTRRIVEPLQSPPPAYAAAADTSTAETSIAAAVMLSAEQAEGGAYDENHTRLCNLCGRSFQTEGGFRSHLKAHEANENFRCEICSKTMRTQQTFQVGQDFNLYFCAYSHYYCVL